MPRHRSSRRHISSPHRNFARCVAVRCVAVRCAADSAPECPVAPGQQTNARGRPSALSAGMRSASVLLRGARDLGELRAAEPNPDALHELLDVLRCVRVHDRRSDELLRQQPCDRDRGVGDAQFTADGV